MTRPVTIEVHDGQVAGITYAEAQNPAPLDVTYAEETGVPLAVDIDISEQMADEEIRFQVTGFEALQ